jgi:hypothetical protein
MYAINNIYKLLNVYVNLPKAEYVVKLSLTPPPVEIRNPLQWKYRVTPPVEIRVDPRSGKC